MNENATSVLMAIKTEGQLVDNNRLIATTRITHQGDLDSVLDHLTRSGYISPYTIADRKYYDLTEVGEDFLHELNRQSEKESILNERITNNEKLEARRHRHSMIVSVLALIIALFSFIFG